MLDSRLSASYASDATGCPGSFANTTAAPEQAQDTLQIVSATPGNDAPVSGALLTLGGLKVTARYLLQSRAGATLAVRLFDQDGNRRGDAGEIGITRPASCPNPLPTREFVFSAANLDLIPNQGNGNTVPTSLTLSALFIDSATGAVFKRADLTYRIIPDAIAFDGTPSINGQSAPDGSTLPADGKVNFNSALRYHLTSDVRGRIQLKAFNASNGGQIASKDLGAVAATASPTLWNTPLDFQFTVPVSVTELHLVAQLVADNGAILKTAGPLSYRSSSFGIALGQFDNAGDFAPFVGPRDQPTLVARGKIKEAFELPADRSLALGVTDDLMSPAPNFVATLLLSEKRADGSYVRKDQIVWITLKKGFPRPSFTITLPSEAPDDADLWELKLVFFPVGKDPLISKPLLLNIDRVRVVRGEFSPVRRVKLEGGKIQTFRYKLEYNVTRTGASQLFVQIVYNISSRVEVDPVKLLDLNGGDHNPANPPFTEFAVRISDNPNVRAMFLYFYLSNATDKREALSRPVGYDIFQEELPISRGATTVTSTLGVNMNGVQNLANRTVTLVRNAAQFKGFLDANKLSLTGGETTADGTPHFALRYAEAASLLRDFIGVNAYWEFDPPIPADGSFAADLTFSYDAEMLPDDPNFSEAALKVASFDPDSGQLVSYPTTVNTGAKTATAGSTGWRAFTRSASSAPLRNAR